MLRGLEHPSCEDRLKELMILDVTSNPNHSII